MDAERIKDQQREERTRCLRMILESTAKRKVIVAGAGTGKTFTFGEMLKRRPDGNNLAMTFINKLVVDMEAKFGALAEVKTFHKYCKKILHAQMGKVEIAPYLTKIIGRDAGLLGIDLSDFDSKFQLLEETSPELMFHLKRGDYYQVVGFDDSVFRLYKMIRSDPDALPLFDQIVIDEFQDFNPLEVAFIKELSKKGDLLVVGDDDQAVYDGRHASPQHLRQIFESGEFERFELPFCNRCPEVIVGATNGFIEQAQKSGCFKGRIKKRYECYLENKEADSVRYPKILLAHCSTVAVVSKYIKAEISKIDPADIAESYKEGDEYPTVLIVGPKHYLKQIEKSLEHNYPGLIYSPSSEIGYGIVEAYQCLLSDEESNLGWRILIELFLEEEEQRRLLKSSENGTARVELLNPKFVANQARAVGMIRAMRSQEETLEAVECELGKSLDSEQLKEVVSHFLPKEAEEEAVTDKNAPTVLLTSFVGCKGLSAGHVFIVGANNTDSMPKDPTQIRDVEISQFIVALTRTRKQCHIVSNNWFIGPKDKTGWIERLQRSIFVSWIPNELVEERGNHRAKNFE
jgi:ATP-dependent DNA helicase UvrD/PcrA